MITTEQLYTASRENEKCQEILFKYDQLLEILYENDESELFDYWKNAKILFLESLWVACNRICLELNDQTLPFYSQNFIRN